LDRKSGGNATFGVVTADAAADVDDVAASDVDDDTVDADDDDDANDADNDVDPGRCKRKKKTANTPTTATTQ
jgi:hypothetical protein